MEKKKQQKAKAPYEPPVLKRIDLRAEEVLASGCKTATTENPLNVPCTASGCELIGS